MNKKDNKIWEEVHYDSIKSAILLIGLFSLIKAFEKLEFNVINIIATLSIYIIIYRVLMFYVEVFFYIEKAFIEFLNLKSAIWKLVLFPLVVGLLLIAIYALVVYLQINNFFLK